ncbi:MAG: hypothetical protein SFV15_24150 [Polyangiaceae bacterium]|nr:hypothetical protein [Polyangiaceae bacterium]
MEQLIEGLVAKVGLSKEQAAQVVAFLKEHAHEVPGWLGLDVNALKDKLPGGLGKLF